MPALYTSSSYELAITEAHQGLPFKLQPLTVVSYAVDHDSVLDLSSVSASTAAGAAFEDIQCAWELIAFGGGTPPSCTLADDLIGQGVGGIIAPSFAQRADRLSINVVFWDLQASPPRQVAVNDDENRLPKDDTSWRQGREAALANSAPQRASARAICSETGKSSLMRGSPRHSARS